MIEKPTRKLTNDPPPCRRPQSARLVLCECVCVLVGPRWLFFRRASERGPSTRILARMFCLASCWMYSLTIILDIVIWCSQLVLGLLEKLILRFSGESDLFPCFVRAWRTNNKNLFNVVFMFFKSWKCVLIVKTQVLCKILILV